MNTPSPNVLSATKRRLATGFGWPRLLMLVVLLGSFGLRSYGLGARSLMYDEGWSWYYASGSLREILDATSAIDLPPLYFLLLHGWIALVGQSEFAMRFLMLLPSVAVVALLFVLGRRLFGMPVGLLAATLGAVQPVQVFYAHSLRMYPLATLLVLLAAYLAYLAVVEGKLGYWLGYAAAASLALYTHYHSGFPLVALSLVFLAWWVLRSRQRGPLFRWLASQMLVVLAFVPWLPFVSRYVAQPGLPPWRTFVGFNDVLLDSWWGWVLLPGSTPHEVAAFWAPGLLLLVLAVIGVSSETSKRKRSLIAALLVLPLLILYGVSFIEPVFHSRYVVPLAPVALLALALGLWRLRSIHMLLLVVALLGVAATWSYVLWRYHRGAFANDDYRALAEYLAASVRPGDALLVHAGYAYPPFLYYYRGEITWRGRLRDYSLEKEHSGEGLLVLQGGSLVNGFVPRSDDYYLLSEEEQRQALDAVLRSHPRLWMLRVYNTVVDPQERTEGWLAQRARLVQETTFNGTSFMQLRRYASRLAPAPAGEKQPDSLPTFGGRIKLVGSDLGLSPVDGREVVRLSFYWQAEERMERDYHFFVHLRDEQGRVVAQFDGVSLEGTYPTSQWTPGEILRDDVDISLSALDHPLLLRAEVGWYDPDGMERLLLESGRSEIEVGRFRAGPVMQVSSALGGEPMVADFAGKLALRDYAVSASGGLEVAAGQPLQVHLTWQALAAIDEDYTVFLHLVDREGRLVAQSDHYPGEGLLPTSYWRLGEAFADEHGLQVPARLAPGEYDLLVGLYLADSGRRLAPTQGAGDSWRLGSVSVR